MTGLLGPGRVGHNLQQHRGSRLDMLGVPRDARGIVLACGYVASAAFGLATLISLGDPIGWAYILLAAVGYFYLQTRGLPAFLWLLMAAWGAVVAVSGNPSGWVECGLGALLMLVALLPLPRPSAQQTSMAPVPAHVAPASAPPIAEPPAPSANGHVKLEASDKPPVRIALRTIGVFSIRAGDRDLTSTLDDKPLLALLFRLLLAGHALGRPKLARAAIGDELSPGYPASGQLERVRKQLWDLQHDPAPEVGALVRANRSHVWLDLEDVDCDLSMLARLARQVQPIGSFITSELAGKVREALEQTAGGEFLGGFEELEESVTGQSTAVNTVRTARTAVANLRADLIVALTVYEDALGRPGSTIQYLRDGLEELQERQDIARLLASAYLKTGQTARANEVRNQFAFSKE